MSVMQTEAHKDQQTPGNSNAQSISACPNCGVPMPREMRFCRACGCRLGEGVEEYTETVRFTRAPDTSRNGKPSTAKPFAAWSMPPLTARFDQKEFKAMARRMHEQTVRSVTSGLGKWKVGRACKRVPRWMVWVIIPIMIASMTGGFRSGSRSGSRSRSAASASTQGSYFGAHYKTANGGAFIQDVTPPGSAADKAGLVGGDVITSFDGKPVKSESDLNNFLTATPIGKTVDVVYLRDGETKTSRLTTISEKENERLADVFDDRPEGNGFLGVNPDFKRVQVPGMSIYGVKLGKVQENHPAYTAGLLEGDIVIEFDGAPIRTGEELNKRIDRALPRSTVKVVVVRGIERLEIPVKMGVE
jgi:PDZ domain-containing protein